jgi:hypothetical protein
MELHPCDGNSGGTELQPCQGCSPATRQWLGGGGRRAASGLALRLVDRLMGAGLFVRSCRSRRRGRGVTGATTDGGAGAPSRGRRGAISRGRRGARELAASELRSASQSSFSNDSFGVAVATHSSPIYELWCNPSFTRAAMYPRFPVMRTGWWIIRLLCYPCPFRGRAVIIWTLKCLSHALLKQNKSYSAR